MDKSSFPYLGSNVRDTATGNIFHSTVDTDIFEIPLNSSNKVEGSGGDSSSSSSSVVRVGVFGVCTQATPNLAFPTAAVTFENVIAHSKRCIQYLKSEQKCDIVCAFTHVGLESDKEIAEIPGLDIIIGGHDHDPYMLLHHGTLIFKCGMNLDYLGIVDLDLSLAKSDPGDGCGHRTVSIAHSVRLLASTGAPNDPRVDEVIAHWNGVQKSKTAGMVNEEVCTVNGSTTVSTLSTHLRQHETAFACHVADALLHCYTCCEDSGGCDAALINGGFIRNNMEYVPGTVLSRSDFLEELPFQRTAVLISISGLDLRRGLEEMIATAPHPSGSFPHLSEGFKATYDLSQPPMQRIVSVHIKGEPLEDTRLYRVSISDFYVRSEGDSVLAFHGENKILMDRGIVICDCVMTYLKGKGTINGDAPGRFTKI